MSVSVIMLLLILEVLLVQGLCNLLTLAIRTRNQ